jgi:NAD-dependent deacetylase
LEKDKNMNKKKIVFFTGAGISAESGISTFRDSDGLWENHSVEEVATKKAWQVNRSKLLDFYNKRRDALREVEPNDAHRYLASLEDKYDVVIITQNVDDLHERGGSTNVIHLHGELTKCRSSRDPNLLYDYENDIEEGHKAEDGSQLRPHIVLFGEDVPNMEIAVKHVITADILIIIGSSMQVYPAAGVVDYVAEETPIIYLDPVDNKDVPTSVEHIKDTAVSGVKKLDIYLKKLVG